MCRSEFHSPHLSSIATLPCEIRNSNVKLRQNITKENGIKIILASFNVFQGHVPYIYLFYCLQCFDAVVWVAGRASGL